MPHVLDPLSSGSRKNQTKGKPLAEINHGYRYPGGRKLRPETELHDELVTRVMTYARDSYNRMSGRHSDWREVDRVLKAYQYVAKPGGPEKKSGRDERGEPSEEIRRIVMPVSFVILETLLTYFTAAFMQRPVYEFEGSGPEDVLGSILLTEIIDSHIKRNAIGLAFHTAWRDMFAYGVGYASPMWHQDVGRRVEKGPVGVLDTMLNAFFQTGTGKVESDYQILYEGNKLINIDPYLALPDPHVAAHDIQEGEFFGWIDEGTLSGWLREEAGPREDLFNFKYLKEFQAGLTSSLVNRGERNKRKDYPMQGTNPVDVIWMYVDLIPEEWKLGRGKNPETWIFGVAADKILVKAEPLNLIHGKIPVAAGAPDTDGYSASPISRLLAIEELQMLIDFLYTTHVENIKRVLNDNIVYDPTLIFSKDLNDNRPGKRIRLRKRAWGRGGIKDNAIFQLDVKDVTQQNVQEALFLADQAKAATSTMDSLQGQFAPRTSRISASEARDTRMSGLSRLERPAQLVSLQFMLPIARMMASNVQQFMSQEIFVKTTGELEQRLREDFGMDVQRERVQVQPLDLLVEYDVSAHDGAIPGKENIQALTDMFQFISQQPELAQNFDIFRMVKHIMREAGAKNVDAFIRRPPQAQVMDDAQVAQEVDRGNLIPAVGGDGAAA